MGGQNCNRSVVNDISSNGSSDELAKALIVSRSTTKYTVTPRMAFAFGRRSDIQVGGQG